MWLVSYLFVLEFHTPMTSSEFSLYGEMCAGGKAEEIRAPVHKEVSYFKYEDAITTLFFVPCDELSGNVVKLFV